MPRFGTVIFDLDGTLLNTLADLTASVNHALAAHGFPHRTQEEVRGFVGNGIGLLIRRALPHGAGPEAEALVLRGFKAHYALHNQDQTRPYPGILDMLKALEELGVRLAIVSNKNDENVKALAREYFGITAALGEKPSMKPKPAPDSVLATMEQLKAHPSATLYVGDSQVDVETARNAGIFCLACTWGFRSEEELRAAGAEAFAHTPQDVVDFVKGV